MSFAAAAGAAAGGFFGYLGQRSANDANKDIAYDTNKMSAEEAEKNRQFQQASADKQMDFQSREAQYTRTWEERMSNTAYQRAAADMKAAGINPLSMSNSGASTPSAGSPSGAAASGGQASFSGATMRNTMEGFASIAKDAAAIDNMGEQNKLLKAQAVTALSSAKNLDQDTKKKFFETINESKWSPANEAINTFLKRMIEGTKAGAKEIRKSLPKKYESPSGLEIRNSDN